ncbi:MAG: hypothetical protein ACE5PV_10415 [Candidatus Poribacteria bacterium]
MPKFPSITIEGVEVPKALIGINSLLGWSHTSRGRDEWIRRYFTVELIAEVFATAVNLGVTGVLGPVHPKLIDAIKLTEDITGEKMTFVATTIGAKEETKEQIKILKDFGAPFCCLHGGWADKWEIKDGRFVDLEDYLKRIRDAYLIPGSATHNGERLKMMDENGYDISVFVTPVNKMGFYMNPSKEAALDAVNNCRKPVIAIKPLASGRFDEGRIKEWLQWVFDVRGVDSMVIGFMSPEEATEDIIAAKEILGVE